MLIRALNIPLPPVTAKYSRFMPKHLGTDRQKSNLCTMIVQKLHLLSTIDTNPRHSCRKRRFMPNAADYNAAATCVLTIADQALSADRST